MISPVRFDTLYTSSPLALGTSKWSTWCHGPGTRTAGFATRSFSVAWSVSVDQSAAWNQDNHWHSDTVLWPAENWNVYVFSMLST